MSTPNDDCCTPVQKPKPVKASCCGCGDEPAKSHDHDGHDHDDDDHNHGGGNTKLPYILATISLVLLLSGLFIEHVLKPEFFTGYLRFGWYLLAYIPVAYPVIREGVEAISKGDFFNEFTLMSVATIGAFVLEQHPEGVAVMLFYAIGELFQNSAVSKAKNNIRALMDVRPQTASLKQGDEFITIAPEKVNINDVIRVLAGERVPLDGTLLTASGNFNTIALTGESVPRGIKAGETVMAGMLNIDNMIDVKVTKKYQDSAISRIIDMVENAATRKAPTELFIRKFARIYTPIVFLLAVLLVIVPYFFVRDYSFNDWLYRALVFLVISCPCALVISIPLGYFGGIGAGSKNGILFKGGNFIDLMAKINTLVLDKTGTLTEGVFNVQEISTDLPETEFISYLAEAERNSTHPIAKAICEYAKDKSENLNTENSEEISGHGLKATINGREILAGNAKLLRKFNIAYPPSVDDIVETIVVMAIDGKYTGYVTIADKPKDDAKTAIANLNQIGLNDIYVLSGDKNAITQKVAASLGIKNAFGDLLPQDKVAKVDELKKDKSRIIAFVGDGINDAPALALSDVGIAMGGLGSDAAIETADIVIQTDQPSKIATAIAISKNTKRVVWQNIGLAFGVKAIVLILGAGGIATMWEAVFADVGVSLLAILNAVRVQNMKFHKN